MYIFSYNSLNKVILERSYKNLDPFSFKYDYLGPLITVNEDKGIYFIIFFKNIKLKKCTDIIVQRGSFTEILSITLDYPSS